MTTSQFMRTAVVAALLCIMAGQAMAQGTRDLPDREVSGRIEFIQNALDEGQHAATLWWDGWLIGYSVATFGQVASQSGTNSEKQNQDLLVGAATTGLGAVGQLVYPFDAGRVASMLRAMPGDTPEARRDKLASAEGFLRRTAAQEAFGRSWKTHAISGVVNLAAGLVVWRHYDRPARDGLLTFALGQLVSEVQIFTQPTKAVRDLREYEARSDFGRGGATGSAHSTWYVSATPAGFLVGCRF